MWFWSDEFGWNVFVQILRVLSWICPIDFVLMILCGTYLLLWTIVWSSLHGVCPSLLSSKCSICVAVYSGSKVLCQSVTTILWSNISGALFDDFKSDEFVVSTISIRLLPLVVCSWICTIEFAVTTSITALCISLSCVSWFTVISWCPNLCWGSWNRLLIWCFIVRDKV